MGSAQSVHEKLQSSLLCRLSQHDLDASKEEFTDVNQNDVEQPVCQVIRQGRYRALASLLARGAKISSSLISKRDHLDLIQLAIEGSCGAIAFTLCEMGIVPSERHVYESARRLQVQLVRVLASRCKSVDMLQVAKVVLLAEGAVEQKMQIVYLLPWNESIAFECIKLLVKVRDWPLCRRLVKYLIYQDQMYRGNVSSGTVALSREWNDFLVDNALAIPEDLRSVIVKRCDWRPSDLERLATWLSKTDLLDVVRDAVDRIEQADEQLFTDMWAFWSHPLNAAQMCAVHWIAALGDAERLEYALKTFAPVVCKTLNGNTPLHMITGMGDSLGCIQLLRMHGASVDEPNVNGETPLMQWERLGPQSWMPDDVLVSFRKRLSNDGKDMESSASRDSFDTVKPDECGENTQNGIESVESIESIESDRSADTVE